MRQPLYPSDISREQFEQIRPLLEQARKQTKPRQLDLYDLWCGLNYQLHTGCTWRDLPKDYPKWQSVYSYYLKWSESRHNNPSVLQQALAKLATHYPAIPEDKLSASNIHLAA